MTISVLDLFTIGIGPSSSHTVGPMRAARRFLDRLNEAGLLDRTARIEAHLYGSLALTGKGHGTDKAVLLGLEGETPEDVDVDTVADRVERIRMTKSLRLPRGREIPLDETSDLLFHRRESLPEHPNGMRFIARDAQGAELLAKTYFSVGGGFVVGDQSAAGDNLKSDAPTLPFAYRSGDDLLRLARESQLSISEMTLRNEAIWRPEAATRAALLRVWQAMQSCVERGCRSDGILPGGLKIVRRAPKLFRELSANPEVAARDPLDGARLGEPMGDGRERRKRRGRPRGDCAHQRCGRHHSGGVALLRACSRRDGRGSDRPLPAHGGRDRDPL